MSEKVRVCVRERERGGGGGQPYLTTIFLYCSSSFNEGLVEIFMCLDVARSENSKITHNVLRSGWVLEGLEGKGNEV